MNFERIKSEQSKIDEETLDVSSTVAAILSDVRRNGDSAVKKYTKRFDGIDADKFLVTEDEAQGAVDLLPTEIVEELDFAMNQVESFAKAQRQSMHELDAEFVPGLRMGHRILPVNSCACYAPAGRYPCLTTAVMTVMPAKVAGVKRIIACSPPMSDGKMNSAILYTMHKMGVDEIYCLGGAQAVGAFAYGTESISPVDLIVGPGNQYVAEAKRQVYGQVGIDLIAGPSECLVLADESGRAEIIAADIIAQCEHDPNARGSIVTTSEKLARKCLAEIDLQLGQRTTEEVARASWKKNGEVVLVESIDDGIAYVNDYAPEHLELHVEDADGILPSLDCYGSVFLGEDSAEVYADKIAGVNHVLPTGRNARFSGGLWVGTYVKVITHLKATMPATRQLAKYTETQSKFEGMDGHRYAATIRLNEIEK